MKSRSSFIAPFQGTGLPQIEDISRRRLISGALASAFLIACGGDDEHEPMAEPSGAANAPWHFEDDRGISITLPKRPERIVAQVTAAASLWNYGVRPVGIFGPQRNEDGSQNIEVGNVDLSTVTSVGEAFGEIDIEKVASLRPDLIVTLYYGGDTVWSIPLEAMGPMQEIAPIAAIRVQDVPIDSAIARFSELSMALGSDLNSEENVAAKNDYDNAVNDLKSAIASKPGLKVLVLAARDDVLYIANPSIATDLMYFRELGLDIVQPPVTTYYEELSWEQVNRYPADLILTDQRQGRLTHEELLEKELWRSLPAVQANQVGAWAWRIYSHFSYTPALQDLAQLVRSSRADVV